MVGKLALELKRRIDPRHKVAVRVVQQPGPGEILVRRGVIGQARPGVTLRKRSGRRRAPNQCAFSRSWLAARRMSGSFRGRHKLLSSATVMLLQASSLALPSNHAAAIEQSPRHKGIKLILADLQPGEHLAAGRMLDEAVGAEVAQAQQPASSIAAVTHADMDAAAVLPDAIEQLALPVHALRKAHHYLGYVRQASERFDVPVGLIMGVIHSESHFNSVAESQKNAQGLMQVVARTGGKEAFALVYKREGKPSIDQLRDPRTNILLGTAYLKKLERVYFKHIRNTEVRLAAVIAAYNAGPTKLRRIFATHGKPETLEQLKRLLARHAPVETQRYLTKVSKRMKVYTVIHARGIALTPTKSPARANLG